MNSKRQPDWLHYVTNKKRSISSSLLRCVHVRLELPHRIWEIIKEFLIMTKEHYKLCQYASRNGVYIKNGVIVDFRYYKNIFKKLKRCHVFGSSFSRNGPCFNFGRKTISRKKDDTFIFNLSYKKLLNISTIGKVLNLNERITSLNLSNNELINIECLKNALKTNVSIKEIDLSHNKIKCIKPLAIALKRNKVLEKLDLSMNEITDITFLAEVLKKNTTLKELFLQNNRILSSLPLEFILLHNTSLTEITIITNPWTHYINCGRIIDLLTNNFISIK